MVTEEICFSQRRVPMGVLNAKLHFQDRTEKGGVRRAGVKSLQGVGGWHRYHGRHAAGVA